MPKNGKSGPHCCGREGSTQFAQQFVSTVTAPPLVGCVVCSREIGVNSSIQDRRQVDRGFYGVESVVRGNADSLLNDPLLLLLALAGDVHPNPGLSRYPCSVCFKNVTSQGTSYLCTRCSHWVHSRCSGLRNAADYRRAKGWICTARMTPLQPRAPSPRPSPAHTPTMSDKMFNILQGTYR